MCRATAKDLELSYVEEGFCNYQLILKSKSLTFSTINANFAYVLPVLMFFIFDVPHDWFVILGKDPDRIYSRFQLTLEERAKR